jgi:two-component system NtrC family response regulator
MSKESLIRILLVDDEETLLEYTSKRLIREGFHVKAASSGEEALEVARQESFDVAVVDLKMPGIDGVETQRGLRKLQPYLQCIVLTGYGSVETALESGREDAFQYLLKPIEYEELVEVIKEAYRKKVEIQGFKFREQVEEISRSGLGKRGMKKAIDRLRKIYGMDSS